MPGARATPASRACSAARRCRPVPEEYPEFDYLHLGEIGDATDALIAALDETASPPPVQRRFTTAERLPLADFPIPGLSADRGETIFPRQRAVFERLPVSLRIL